ncbi:6-phosphogluconolactonase [filamentous cyanobacterium LEGE 11480]|uniref:6-phosphogluconolactonase n=1 Tax=Romeriopsis navalis LEGE 11480 TaxID=2777977 RepID=A0A928VSR5_9CYAN|nr:6-phosphogluconolactonase [Romeriopsis navalis]MBE9031544.1 6-phosphogluconolactonase [Romeriopsis navalis LEGE 11480]
MTVEAAPPIIEVLSDKSSLVDRAYEHVLQMLQQAITDRGQATIALSGGSTPKPLYERLAQADLPWDKVHIFWGDERYVAPDHPDSNYLMSRLAWLDRVDFPAANIHPIPTADTDPVVSAQQYAQELQQFFQCSPQEFPQFDVMLLGMGDDGHTASLFPGTAALKVSDRLVTVGEKAGEPRITLTVPVINHARLILFMVAGANKQTALSQIFAPVADDLAYPSRLIRSPANNLIWLLDQAAAGGIPNNIELLYPYRPS